MMDLNSKVAQLLEKLVNRWSFWDEHEDYYLETLAPKLVANLATSPDKNEVRLLHEIREILSPRDWQNLPELIREYRAEVHRQKEREKEAERQRAEERKQEELRRETERRENAN